MLERNCSILIRMSLEFVTTARLTIGDEQAIKVSAKFIKNMKPIATYL